MYGVAWGSQDEIECAYATGHIVANKAARERGAPRGRQQGDRPG